MTDLPLASSQDAFPNHVFDAFGVPPGLFDERIGGSVMIVAKRPSDGPLTLLTAGVSRLPVDAGTSVELAVEVVEGQEGAALVALRIVCDDIAVNRRTPPLETPWRNGDPFLSGTQISAIMATGSRWGSELDDVLDAAGNVVGHVRTLRLLTDAEAQTASRVGWSGLVDEVGSIDALLDVTRP